MKKSIKILVAMLLTVITVTGITISNISANGTTSDAPATIANSETGAVIGIASPDANGDSDTTATNKDDGLSNSYGTIDWSTAAQGYITFTAKGQERRFILEGPNGKQAMFTVQKDETIEVPLIDGTGTYQYAIAGSANGKAQAIQYKNSFSVGKIDGGLAPCLVSNPWGDYGNAPDEYAN